MSQTENEAETVAQQLVAASTPQATPSAPFSCRICGSKEFIPIPQPFDIHIPMGTNSPILGHECVGCSVQFGNPAKFSTSASQQKEVVLDFGLPKNNATLEVHEPMPHLEGRS